jgi:hypothetical protein
VESGSLYGISSSELDISGVRVKMICENIEGLAARQASMEPAACLSSTDEMGVAESLE